MIFTEAPEALSGRQKAIFWAAAVLCAASRFAAVSRSLWDWDEALFSLGMRSYDVASHHPHPPGFPVYIGAAKLVALFGVSDFHALQALNVAASVVLFPGMFLLARELRLSFTTSVVAAGLFAFFPNVWFFGGTAFSDVVSITLVVWAAALLFRGCRDSGAYLAGALLLALSIGIRPQNLLVGLFPAAVSTWVRARRSPRDVLFALLIGATVVGASYAAAVRLTGFDRYMSAMHAHSDYITTVDSFRSPERPPLWRLIDRFFFKQYQNPALSIIATLFVLVSIVNAVRTHNRAMLANALTFGPFAISAWLMLDRFSISRFSIGYQPMFALFAADGIARVMRNRKFEALAGALLVAAFAVWTWPALTVVRTTVSPPVLGVEAARAHIDSKRDELFVAFGMTPFIDDLLPNVPYTVLLDDRALPLKTPDRPAYLLAEIEQPPWGGWIFERPHGHLWDIARRHYFGVGLEPIRHLARFGDGWWPVEGHGEHPWRWMGDHGRLLLPPVGNTAKLELEMRIPDEIMRPPPTIRVILNGALVARFAPSEAHFTRQYEVGALPGENSLEITTTRTINQAKRGIGPDARELGLMLEGLSWGTNE